jgi:nicotinate-nucleotide adenylyltransferase
MKVALFGTSADPPTIAHQQIITWLASQFDLVAVLISEIEPPVNRHAQVYRSLSSRRTFESLITAQKIWGDSEFILTIGADLITQLPQWYRASELLDRVKLLIVPRTGNKIEPTDLQRLRDLGAQIAIAPLSTPAISSTAIRNSHSIQGIAPSVATYIQNHNLYSIINALK